MGWLDNMVSAAHTMEVFDACLNEILITHEGSIMSLQIQTLFSRLWLLLMRALKEKQYCLSGRDACSELKNRGLIGAAEVPELETRKKRSRGCVVCAYGK